jgi:hypothetical protein
LPSTKYGHLVLHYPTPTDGPKAARLLKALGVHLSYNTETRTGNFWHFVLDRQAEGETDRIVYLMNMPARIRAVHDAINAHLGDSAEVRDLRAAQADDPELGFHAATVVHSLENLESMVVRLRALGRDDPDLQGRLRVTQNRARRNSGGGRADGRLAGVLGRGPLHLRNEWRAGLCRNRSARRRAARRQLGV